MIFGVLGILIALLAFGPFLWVRYVMWHHSKEIDGMPGTGGELAQHLVERFQLEGVEVVRGNEGEDFYHPDNKQVSLSPRNYDGKSLTAVAVAAHEVGHAIQFCRNEPVSQLRTKYLNRAFAIQRAGNVVIGGMLMITMVVRTPALLLITGVVGIVTMLASVMMYVAILPEEYDASFNKALPILEEGYVPDAEMDGVRQVLKAAALTYVAGALTNILNLWRWIRFVR